MYLSVRTTAWLLRYDSQNTHACSGFAHDKAEFHQDHNRRLQGEKHRTAKPAAAETR